jgi:hypothetical protein
MSRRSGSVGGLGERPPRPTRRSIPPINKPACGNPQAGFSGGGGNCTLHPDYLTHCPQISYEATAKGAQEMCREDAALREVVTTWHRLSPTVRDALLALVRSSQS